MKELIEIAVALIISLIFALGEIAVTVWANEKTTEKLIKHNDESTRQIIDAIKRSNREEWKSED